MIFCTDNDFIQKKLETGSILIVEDSSFFNNALRKGLTFLGYDVTSAYKLKEALSYIEKRSFDLIILDLHLPDGEGEDLFKQLNTKQKQEIVIYTSYPDQEPRDEWLHNGTNEGGGILEDIFQKMTLFLMLSKRLIKQLRQFTRILNTISL